MFVMPLFVMDVTRQSTAYDTSVSTALIGTFVPIVSRVLDTFIQLTVLPPSTIPSPNHIWDKLAILASIAMDHFAKISMNTSLVLGTSVPFVMIPISVATAKLFHVTVTIVLIP